jgi:hypothetical protein
MKRFRRGALVFAVLAVAGAAGCRKAAGPKPPAPLHGNAVWFADGIAGDDAAIEESLLRFRCAAVFLPARRIAGAGAAWSGLDAPAPPQPFARIPVILVIGADADPLAGRSDNERKRFGSFLAGEISSVLARGAAFGTVRGVHLDIPFSADTAAAHADALRDARSRVWSRDLARRGKAPPLPAEQTPISWSLRQALPADEKEREAVAKFLSRTDGLVAFVFGEHDAADPAQADSLGKPWWAAYESSGGGRVRRASGEVANVVDEGALDRLTNDPRMELLQELPWNEGKGWAFSLRAKRGLETDGGSVAAGDSVAFQMPSLADMVARFPEDAARRRFHRGRVVVFRGHSDARRQFSTAALEDVVLGRPSVPKLRLWTESEGGGLLRVGGENAAPHGSVVSQIQNWVEVDVAPARVWDVETGGFERWEAHDDHDRPVTPGRASRVRLYETFIAPLERFEPARLRLRGSAPSPCCRIRTHFVPATGGEVVTDWALPGTGGATPAARP